MRISDWSSDVCSSDLEDRRGDAAALRPAAKAARLVVADIDAGDDVGCAADEPDVVRARGRPRLAEEVPIEIAQSLGGAAGHDPLQHMDDLIAGHRVPPLLGPKRRARLRLSVLFGGV